MTYTPFANYTDEELLRHGLSMSATPTPLETELLLRMERLLDEEKTCKVVTRCVTCGVCEEGEV